MLKVLQILNGLYRGGMETFVMNVYRAVDKSQVQFDFLLNQHGGDYEEEAKLNGAKLYYVGTRREEGFLQYCKNLESFFKEHKSDYVAVHYHESTLSSLEPLFYAKKYGVSIRVLHAHSSSVSGSRLHYLTHFANKVFVKSLATDYLACSQKALEWFYNGTGVKSRSRILANGINVDNYVFNEGVRNYMQKKLGVDGSKLVVGHIGRFSWIKNHKFLVEVFERIHKQETSSKLLLIGQGSLMEQVKEQVHSKGLEDCVLFLGLRDDIPAILQAIDVIIMPSVYEGLPVSLVEAQAAGALVFGSNTISHDCAITPDMHFISLDEPSDAWASRILDEYKNRCRSSLSAEMVKKAGFDVNTIAKELARVYSSR